MNNDHIMAILLVAALFVAVLVTRRDARAQGAANPVGTGTVQREVSEFGGRLSRVEATVTRIEKDLERGPSSADVERLRGDIKAIQATVSGTRGHIESVDQAVVRIEMKLDSLAPAPITRRRK